MRPDEELMRRSIGDVTGRLGMLAGAMFLLALVPATPATAWQRQHVMFAFGGVQYLSDQLKAGAVGLDLTEGAFGFTLAYRYSLGEQLDLTLDFLDIESLDTPKKYDDAEMSLSTSFTGPGVRFHPATWPMRAYVQANVFFVSETARLDQNETSLEESRHGAGFGLSAGAEVRATRRWSFPVGVHFLAGRPADDVTSLAATIGAALNFFEGP